MNKMIKRAIAWLTAATLSISMICPGAVSVHAEADTLPSKAPILETDVSEASGDCTLFGIYGSYYSDAQAALDKINEIRKEACEEGDVPNPDDPSKMLTPSDYKPLKWSTGLERMARIRAMEAGLSYAFMDSGHNRPSEKSTFSVSYDNVHSRA